MGIVQVDRYVSPLFYAFLLWRKCFVGACHLPPRKENGFARIWKSINSFEFGVVLFSVCFREKRWISGDFPTLSLFLRFLCRSTGRDCSMMYARTTNSKCEQKTARKRLMVVDPAKAEKVSGKESHFTF